MSEEERTYYSYTNYITTINCQECDWVCPSGREYFSYNETGAICPDCGSSKIKKIIGRWQTTRIQPIYPKDSIYNLWNLFTDYPIIIGTTIFIKGTKKENLLKEKKDVKG